MHLVPSFRFRARGSRGAILIYAAIVSAAALLVVGLGSAPLIASRSARSSQISATEERERLADSLFNIVLFHLTALVDDDPVVNRTFTNTDIEGAARAALSMADSAEFGRLLTLFDIAAPGAISVFPNTFTMIPPNRPISTSPPTRLNPHDLAPVLSSTYFSQPILTMTFTPRSPSSGRLMEPVTLTWSVMELPALLYPLSVWRPAIQGTSPIALSSPNGVGLLAQGASALTGSMTRGWFSLERVLSLGRDLSNSAHVRASNIGVVVVPPATAQIPQILGTPSQITWNESTTPTAPFPPGVSFVSNYRSTGEPRIVVNLADPLLPTSLQFNVSGTPASAGVVVEGSPSVGTPVTLHMNGPGRITLRGNNNRFVYVSSNNAPSFVVQLAPETWPASASDFPSTIWLGAIVADANLLVLTVPPALASLSSKDFRIRGSLILNSPEVRHFALPTLTVDPLLASELTTSLLQSSPRLILLGRFH
jgi:hypothetical protein